MSKWTVACLVVQLVILTLTVYEAGYLAPGEPHTGVALFGSMFAWVLCAVMLSFALVNLKEDV